MAELKVWEDDPSLYLFTSLTAGSSHVITATSRMETILKANRLPFSYIDTATNDSAKKLFQRRARGKKLPLLVKEGFVIADMEQLEDWNEFGEVKEAIGPVATTTTSVTTTPAKAPVMASGSAAGTPSKPAAVAASAAAASSSQENAAPASSSQSSTLKQLAEETASAAQQKKAAPAPLSYLSKAPASDAAAATPAKDSSPLSPSSVPLPATPAVASPTARDTNSPMRVASPLASPSRPSPHGRHSSGGSTHSSHFVPDHFEAPPVAHRGSSLSMASDAEIKQAEADATIHEENEEEDEEDALKKSKAEKVQEEKPVKTEAPKEVKEEAAPAKPTEASLADGLDKVKLEDQEAGEGKHATASVKD